MLKKKKKYKQVETENINFLQIFHNCYLFDFALSVKTVIHYIKKAFNDV